MGKEVTHAVRFRDPIQPSLGPTKQLFVLACDDGSIYEFQRHDDSPMWSMRSRGSVDEPLRSWSQRRAPLPGDVIDTLDEVVGEKRWRK